MLSEFIIIIFLSISSYIGFKFYSFLGILKVDKKDEFLSFKRKNLQTGSGLVFFIIFFIFLFLFYFFDFFVISFPRNFFFFILSLTFITVLSFLDDKYNLDPLLRFSAHLITTFIALSTVPYSLEFLPIKLNILIALITWVYIINLTNFMDGADGFCAILSLNFFLNTILICVLINLVNFSYLIAIITTPILLIFILFNYPPAKLFMGDTGSIFLGFLIGYIIIEMSHSKYFILIISAYAYPLLDASITLFNRILKGYAPWARLGDFYFLKVKKTNNYKRNFILFDRKIFLTAVLQSLFALVTTFIALKLDFHYLSLLNFFFAIIVLKIYYSFKEK